ncbi:MAG: hypothetical protein ABIT09_05150 [Croceibacterium sp.]
MHLLQREDTRDIKGCVRLSDRCGGHGGSVDINSLWAALYGAARLQDKEWLTSDAPPCQPSAKKGRR